MNTFIKYIPYLLSFSYLFISTTNILSITTVDTVKDSNVNSFGILGVITTAISIILFIILLQDYKNLKKLIIKNKLLIILLTLFIASCLWSENRWVSIRKLKNFIGVIIAIMVIVKDNKDNVWLALFYIVLIASILSYFFIFIMPEYGWMIYENSNLPIGIFGHKNRLGIFAAFGCIIAHYLYSNNKKEFYYLLLFFACLGLVLLSKSTTSILALLLSYLIYLIVVSVSGRIWVLFTGISFVILLFLINIYVGYDILSTTLEYFGKDMTFTGRSALWGVLIDIGLKKPILGYGYGSFFRGEETVWLTNLMSWDASHAHNGFLQVFLESGVIGLIIVCCFVISLSKRVITYKNPIILNFLIIFIVSNFSEPGLFNMSFVSIVVLFLYFFLKKEENV